MNALEFFKQKADAYISPMGDKEMSSGSPGRIQIVDVRIGPVPKRVQGSIAIPQNEINIRMNELDADWRKINAALSPLQLAQMQFILIAEIGYLTKDGKEVTQQDVARFAKIDRMLVSQVVRRLADEGLVERCAHAVEKRAWSLSLTKRRANKLAKALPIVEAADEEFFGSDE